MNQGKQPSNVVGKLDLSVDITEVKRDIKRLLKSTWLDNETADHYYKEMHKRRNPLALKALKTQLEAEIAGLKKAYGA
jgi:hypothetical protein